MTSTLLAVYGALLSTVLALIQIGNFQRSRRYLEIAVDRSYGPADDGSKEFSESVEFKVSNRSTNKTEIQNIMIGICEISNDGFVRLFSARGRDAFKSSRIWERGEHELKLPFALNPGESFYVEFETAEANSFISEDRTYLPEKVVLGNVFELEIEHSQGNPRRTYFSMDCRKFAAGDLAEAAKLNLWRSRIWRFHRSPL